MDISGKTAFVTGAASGIGYGIASALAEAGARVMLCDFDQAGLARAVEQLRHRGADVDEVHADVSLRCDLEAAAAATIARFGKVHILVNNAGVSGGGGYGAWTDAAWTWTLDVNLRGVAWGVEIFTPLLLAHGEGGHIVSTASIGGLVSFSSMPYNATKAAVVSLSEGLRRDLAGRGVGVSVLCPGPSRTNIADSEKYLPARFAGASLAAPGSEPTAGQLKLLEDMLAGGVSPAYVGELVREGIEKNWPYIFTENDFEAAVDARFAAIKQGFDLIRERTPQRG